MLCIRSFFRGNTDNCEHAAVHSFTLRTQSRPRHNPLEFSFKKDSSCVENCSSRSSTLKVLYVFGWVEKDWNSSLHPSGKWQLNYEICLALAIAREWVGLTRMSSKAISKSSWLLIQVSSESVSTTKDCFGGQKVRRASRLYDLSSLRSQSSPGHDGPRVDPTTKDTSPSQYAARSKDLNTLGLHLRQSHTNTCLSIDTVWIGSYCHHEIKLGQDQDRLVVCVVMLR